MLQPFCGSSHRHGIRLFGSVTKVPRLVVVIELGSLSHFEDGEQSKANLDNAGGDPDVGAAPVEFCLQLRRTKQRRLQEEVVPARAQAPSLQKQ